MKKVLALISTTILLQILPATARSETKSFTTLCQQGTTQSQSPAENQYVQAPITLMQLEPPKEDTLPPPENARCAQYAQGAVFDYRTMRRFGGKCFIPDSPRWQPYYDNHYQWCLTARSEWLVSESKARNARLMGCGARFNL